MSRSHFVLVSLALLAPFRAEAQQQDSRDAFDSARYAWQSGDYVEALEGFERLLSGPGGEGLVDEIALITGELYRVSEIAVDGGAVRWSRDGRYVAYETGSGPETKTHVLGVTGDGLRIVFEVTGSALTFSPQSERLAYLTLEPSESLARALADLDSQAAAGGRDARMRMRSDRARLLAEHTRIVERELASGRERGIDPDGLGVFSLAYGAGDEELYFVGNRRGEAERSDIYAVTGSGAPRPVTEGPGRKENPRPVLGGSHLAYDVDSGALGIVDIATGRTRLIPAVAPVISADGRTLAFLGSDRSGNTVTVVSLEADTEPVVVSRTVHPLGQMSFKACAACPTLSSLALSPDGSRVAFQVMPREDWEIHMVGLDGTAERQVTREIQHDLFPEFLTNGRLLALKGEARHRRSHLYDLETGEVTWLFRNNTVRTVAPEYEWAPSPDGTRILIVAERDGDTISPERGVYLLDLTRKVTSPEVLERVRANLVAERELRRRAVEMYEPIASEVSAVTAQVSTARIFEYERDLVRLGSKHITQPGNAMAIDYLAERLRSFGYEPELEWFDARGVRTANVIATLTGSSDPAVIYVVSSHFDSSSRGPGADDNSSGTAALLEAARVLAGQPMPATIRFAFFTGEEVGLLGSREFVRRAVEKGDQLVGALNNDMVGWAEDHRLDNTIRYANPGIRDLQHSAAILYSDLVTHDARYFKGTDAHAYVDAFGDIVGGIGSYPILASPHYHQTHDVLETINHPLVSEVSRVTVASVMLMASSPCPLRDLRAERRGESVDITWATALESGVAGYVVAYGPPGDSLRTSVQVSEPRATLEDVGPGAVISVRAIGADGAMGWDWARTSVEK